MFKFEVKQDNGHTYQVEAEPRDVVAWEKANSDGHTYLDLARGGSMVDLYLLAHLTSKRLNMYDGPLGEFETTCNIEVLRPDPEPDPTQPGATADS